MTYRILIADKIAREGLTPLTDDSRFELVERSGLKGDQLAAALADADAVIVRSATRISRDALASVAKLKVIGRAGVGVDTIDVDAATEKGIAVMNAPAGNTISAAELAFALLLALVRRVPAADRSMHDGQWDRTSFSGTELYGKTLGLVGAGRVGSEVARRAQAFGMQVTAYDPFLSEEAARGLGIQLGTLEEVLRAADVLSLHVPLTESTRGLLGEAELAMLKPEAVLINAARGGVVDETALIQRLAAKRLAGAAMDVFEQEPLPADHALRSLPNVVLTPHLGASTEEAQLNVALEIAKSVRAALVEGDLSGAVNAPFVAGDRVRRLRPLLELGERLGRIAAALGDGAVTSVEVRFAGEGEDLLRPLTAGVLVGVLAEAVGPGGVNVVNAPHIARSRGIEVERTRIDTAHDYAEFVEVRATAGGRTTRVAGALLAEGHPRVVRIADFRLDIVPRGVLVLLRNRDVPGVIGRVGSVLGAAGINIAEYHQARLSAGGEALAAISIDSGLEPAVLAALRQLPEVRDAREVRFDD